MDVRNFAWPQWQLRKRSASGRVAERSSEQALTLVSRLGGGVKMWNGQSQRQDNAFPYACRVRPSEGMCVECPVP